MAAMNETKNGSLAGLTATDLSTLVRAGKASPIEVAEAHLARIEALDPRLNAFQEVLTAAVLEEARQLSKRSNLADLPLAGVPVAVKDNVDVAGAPTRQGSAATSSEPAKRDDELVRRLREAGALIIGKTRMSELAVWPLTEPDAYGPTRNPWNHQRSTGGSSGGSAVAVATGMAALGLGSDGGGSLRVPAACCGIIGLKPTPGVVPLAGGQKEHWLGMTAFGPLANTATDAGLMLGILAGRPIATADGMSGLRVAVSTKHPGGKVAITTGITDAVHATGKVLETLGHRVSASDPPYPPDLGLRFMRRWLPGIARDADGLQLDRLEKRTRSMVRAGRFVQRLGLDRSASSDPFRAKVLGWFDAFDVLVMPVLAEPALPLGKWAGKGWWTTTMGVANWILTPAWNIAGCPAASIPAGMSPDGLPLAVQIVAKPGQEALLVAVLQQIEGAQPWAPFGTR